MAGRHTTAEIHCTVTEPHEVCFERILGMGILLVTQYLLLLLLLSAIQSNSHTSSQSVKTYVHPANPALSTAKCESSLCCSKKSADLGLIVYLTLSQENQQVEEEEARKREGRSYVFVKTTPRTVGRNNKKQKSRKQDGWVSATMRTVEAQDGGEAVRFEHLFSM